MDEQKSKLQNLTIDPFEISPEHWEAIRQIARVAMHDYKCHYTKAVVIAYLEWIDLGECVKTEH